MTAQVSDSVVLDGRGYSLAGICGNGLFDPYAVGLEPTPSCTACWRGYQCGYAIRDGRLELAELHVTTDDETPLELFGVKPVPGESFFTWSWLELREPVAFSGGLLIGTDFKDELYVHMGFHPAWKYGDVRECLFQHGRLLNAWDKSAEIARLRDELANRPDEPGAGASRDEIKSWIEECFSLDYQL